jgi:hypothetical protein
MNITKYIRRLHRTNEYIIIFAGTDERVQISSSELRSSVNRRIYPMFVGLEGKFVGFDRRINPVLM